MRASTGWGSSHGRAPRRAAAKEYFASIGITTQGYIQWGDSDKGM